jgi:hypothetical protein
MKKMTAGLLFLALFLAASVGGIMASLPHAPSTNQSKPAGTLTASGDEGSGQKPFARLCGDEGGPGKPFGIVP